MSVTLPAVPRPLDYAPELREFGTVKRSPGGGADMPVGELGDRWTIELTYPAMLPACARAFIAARAQATTLKTTLRAVLPFVKDAPTGVTGTGAVNSTLVNVDDATGIEPGMMFSFEADGRAWLHLVNGKSGATLSITPRLREELSGALEFAAPVVEGLIDGALGWKVDKMVVVGWSLKIAEDR